MRIAVLNEVSAAARNADILRGLEAFPDIEICNVAMHDPTGQPPLTYIQTGIMAATLLNAGCCDLVVGGCGTGQGFLNAVMQFPAVSCGLITNPLDAWLFSQINGGNCISLALNKGYGWAADINLRHIFQELLRDPPGGGYPPERRDSQLQSRLLLHDISAVAHRDMLSVLQDIDADVLAPIGRYDAFLSLLARGSDAALASGATALFKGGDL